MFGSILKTGVISFFESTVYPGCIDTIFRRRIKRECLPEFCSSRDVGISPSIIDPCPNRAAEMAACGLPVITTKESGAS